MPFVIIKYWLVKSFLTILFGLFSNSPYSKYVNKFCLIWFDVIRPLRGICDGQLFIKSLTLLPNCSVGVSVAADRYVNSSIYIFRFYDFLCFTLDLYIPGPLKWLTASGSIIRINSTNSLFSWVPLLILFFLYLSNINVI